MTDLQLLMLGFALGALFMAVAGVLVWLTSTIAVAGGALDEPAGSEDDPELSR